MALIGGAWVEWGRDGGWNVTLDDLRTWSRILGEKRKGHEVKQQEHTSPCHIRKLCRKKGETEREGVWMDVHIVIVLLPQPML